MNQKKYIFVTGGVCSSLGKGITAASLGYLLKANGYKINVMKIDPYLNVDAGTMNPYQHGEVFVTDDGAETDLDLGNYERFVDINTKKYNSVTTGQIYQSVIDAERKGEYLGQTVQVIPHITNEIKRRIRTFDDENNSDIIIVELGGTVGDIEGLPFIEAIRQFAVEEGKKNVKFLHLTLIPSIKGSGELKTKPTQHSVKELMSMGIQPDFLFCRTEVELPSSVKEKIALFCNIEPNCIFSAIDVKKSIYEVPLIFHKQEADKIILEKLGLEYKQPDLSKWEEIVKIELEAKEEVKIALVGKYVHLEDTYKSIDSSFKHAGIANNVKVKVEKIDAESIMENKYKFPDDICGILIPGGFGDRGIEGKIKAIKYARTQNIPLFGICLGLQCMVIEFAKNVCNLKNADSTEFNQSTPEPVVDLLTNLKGIKYLGGTMRKGLQKSILLENSRISKIYNKLEIEERHRHRYEVNPQYIEILQNNGLIISGRSEQGLVEAIELKNHPWYIGVQYHPEFLSRPLKPHPLFVSFVKAALDYKREKNK